MIPYIEVYALRIGRLTFSSFGLLAVLATFSGVFLAERRAHKLGADVDALTSFLWWVLIGAFVTAHVFDEVCYHPAEILKAPWSLFLIWKGLSSFGGFLGAILGGLLWKFCELVPVLRVGSLTLRRPAVRAVPRSILPNADIAASVFPISWIFGRLACAIVHDHPGRSASSSSLFAVAYGPGRVTEYGFFGLHHGTDARYDLGLLELMFTVIVAALFALTWKKRFPIGTYAVASLLIYAPVRFALDFLRAEDTDGGDPRYFWLTPGQWASMAMFLLGLWLASYVRSSRVRSAPCAAPHDEATLGT